MMRCLRGKERVAVWACRGGVVAAVWWCAASARADAITDFAVFGGNQTRIGSMVDAGGLVGSDGNVRVGSRVDAEGLRGGGFLRAGNTLGADGIVFDGDVKVGPKARIDGNVDGGGRVFIGPRGHVQGNVTGGGRVRIGPGTRVIGTLIENGSPAAYMPPDLPAPTDFSAGGENLRTRGREEVDLDPGSFGNVRLGARNIVNLTAGDYFFGSLRIGARAVLNLDLSAGDVRIFATNRVFIGARTTMSLADGDASGVYVEANDFRGGNGNELFGTIFAIDDLVLGAKTDLVGAAWAGDMVRVGSKSMIDLMPFGALLDGESMEGNGELLNGIGNSGFSQSGFGAAQAPAPAALWSGLALLALVMVKRPRRRRA